MNKNSGFRLLFEKTPFEKFFVRKSTIRKICVQWQSKDLFITNREEKVHFQLYNELGTKHSGDSENQLIVC